MGDLSWFQFHQSRGRKCEARSASAPRSSVSACAHELIDAAILRQTCVDVAVRVDPNAVDMATRHARQHLALRITHRDMGWIAGVFLLGDVEISVLAARNVVRATHPGPFAEILSLRREKLDALVGPVGDIERAAIVEGDAVRQVELARTAARRPPRCNQFSVTRETMYPRVAVAVGHINVAIGM